MSVDYLLHESSVGFAIFQVVHQPDMVGNRLKEVQASVQVSTISLYNFSLAAFMTLLLGSLEIREDGQTCQLCAFQVRKYPS